MSRSDPSGADQSDAEHQATDLAVGGWNPSRRAKPQLTGSRAREAADARFRPDHPCRHAGRGRRGEGSTSRERPLRPCLMGLDARWRPGPGCSCWSCQPRFSGNVVHIVVAVVAHGQVVVVGSTPPVGRRGPWWGDKSPVSREAHTVTCGSRGTTPSGDPTAMGRGRRGLVRASSGWDGCRAWRGLLASAGRWSVGGATACHHVAAGLRRFG